MSTLMNMHPAMLILAAATILVNGLLIFQLRRRCLFYRKARSWPRLTVKADRVEMMRVVHTYSGASTRKEYQQAVLHFRYQVRGFDYKKQSVRQVYSAEAAEAMKESAEISFFYNPENPAQTLEEIPGPAACIVTLLGLLFVNATLFGLVHNLSIFLNGGGE